MIGILSRRPSSLLILGGMAIMLGMAGGASAGPIEELGAWLKSDRTTRPDLEAQAFANTPLSAAECALAKTMIWTERTAYVKSAYGAQWTAKRLVNKDDFQMPFDYRIYGSKPAQGYDLYISMHGGGETDAATNDQQWRNQITLYHPAGIYLAPRAPTDAWNMWHKDHIDGFFDQIIQSAVALQGANPNRVYIMGYSAGGDGVYQMAPRMADRWAAAAMMAGYPNHASPINLRDIGFTMHVGALDSSYGRNTMAVTYGNMIKKLQDADPGFYQYDVKVHPGKPHWMDQEDTVALSWIDLFTRNPYPRKVVWHQDTTVGTNSFPSDPIRPVKGAPTQYQFYWVALQERNPQAKPALITAEIKGQEVDIVDANVDSLFVLLNDSLIDLDRPVAVYWKGNKIFSALAPRTLANLYRSVQDRGDRDYAFPVRLKLARTDSMASISPRLQDKRRAKGMGRADVLRSGDGHYSDLRGRSLPPAPP